MAAGLLAFPARATETPDVPEGRWTGRLECTRAVLICADLPVVVVIDRQTSGAGYRATWTYVVGGTEYAGPTLQLALNPELHTLTAHSVDFDQHQFWALRLDGDAISGLRMVNTRFFDRTIYLVRDR
jgi:hypothetical protein